MLPDPLKEGGIIEPIPKKTIDRIPLGSTDKFESLVAVLREVMYCRKKWFGKIEVSIESGNIVNVKVSENIKL